MPNRISSRGRSNCCKSKRSNAENPDAVSETHQKHLSITALTWLLVLQAISSLTKPNRNYFKDLRMKREDHARQLVGERGFEPPTPGPERDCGCCGNLQDFDVHKLFLLNYCGLVFELLKFDGFTSQNRQLLRKVLVTARASK